MSKPRMYEDQLEQDYLQSQQDAMIEGKLSIEDAEIQKKYDENKPTLNELRLEKYVLHTELHAMDLEISELIKKISCHNIEPDKKAELIEQLHDIRHFYILKHQEIQKHAIKMHEYYKKYTIS